MDGFSIVGESRIEFLGYERFQSSATVFRQRIDPFLEILKLNLERVLRQHPVTLTFDACALASANIDKHGILRYQSRGLSVRNLAHVCAQNAFLKFNTVRYETVIRDIKAGICSAAEAHDFLKSRLPFEIVGILEVRTLCGLVDRFRVVVDTNRSVFLFYHLPNRGFDGISDPSHTGNSQGYAL